MSRGLALHHRGHPFPALLDLLEDCRQLYFLSCPILVALQAGTNMEGKRRPL